MMTAVATTAQAWRLHSPTICLTMETSMSDQGLAARGAQAISEFTIDSLQYPETLNMAMLKTSTTRDGLKRFPARSRRRPRIPQLNASKLAWLHAPGGRKRASHLGLERSGGIGQQVHFKQLARNPGKNRVSCNFLPVSV